MRYIVIIGSVFLVISQYLAANTYYCAPSTATPAGSNSNAGTITAPWFTFAYACTQVEAGDTVFFRGGTYLPTIYEGAKYYVNGTVTDTICFFNYPGEVPILDGTNILSNGKYGIDLRVSSYVYIKGLTIRNYLTSESISAVLGMNIYKCSHMKIENCTVYNIGDNGFYIYGGDEISLINCDAYDCANVLNNGQAGDGFNIQLWDSAFIDYTVTLTGCRAWSNSDDGFDIINGGHVTLSNCWAWDNGEMEQGNGNGFKFGFMTYDTDTSRIIENCLAVYNRAKGFHENNSAPNYRRPNILVYNNTAYKNGQPGFNNWITTLSPENQNIYRNNLSYNNTGGEVSFSGDYVHSNNSWDSDVTVTDVDFVSVDSTGISGARQEDGSLPDINFLKLANTSDLIDAGTDVGLDYYNVAPDLGFYEYPTFEGISTPYINTNEPIITRSREVVAGGNLIDAGGGSILAKGVVYSQEINPTTSDSIIVVGTGTDDFTVRVPNLTKSTTYHLRAYATNETGTAYGADVEFTTPASSPVRVGSKLLRQGNYYIKIE